MLKIDILDEPLVFLTAPGLFSPDGLDRGTRALLKCAPLCPGDKVLDLGCGYGVVGIYAAKKIGAPNVTMSDVELTAISLARKNARLNGVSEVRVLLSDGFHDIPDAEYTRILSNPPYHSDFSIAKHFIEKGFNRLAVGGTISLVVKRKEWYKNKLSAIFGGVKTVEMDGYFVLTAEKRVLRYANRL